MTMIAIASGFEFLKAKLTADNGAGGFMTFVTGLYRDIAKPKQDTPYGIIQSQSPPLAALTQNDYRVLSDGLFIAKVVGKSEEDYGAMVSAIKRAYQLLHRTSGTVADGMVLSCAVEDEVGYSEDVDGVIFSHLGIVLRTLLQ